jgi:hypothetical protein
VSGRGRCAACSRQRVLPLTTLHPVRFEFMWTLRAPHANRSEVALAFHLGSPGDPTRRRVLERFAATLRNPRWGVRGSKRRLRVNPGPRTGKWQLRATGHRRPPGAGVLATNSRAVPRNVGRRTHLAAAGRASPRRCRQPLVICQGKEAQLAGRPGTSGRSTEQHCVRAAPVAGPGARFTEEAVGRGVGLGISTTLWRRA